MQHFEKITLENYIEELRVLIEKEEKEELKVRLALHLNNVLDTLEVDPFF